MKRLANNLDLTNFHLHWLADRTSMPNKKFIEDLYIPSDLEHGFPLAPHFVQTFGAYPNYLHFNDDFRPAIQEFLLEKTFQEINVSARVGDEGWHTVERIFQHPDGVLLKIELVGERFCRVSGFFQHEPTAKTLLDGLYEYKYEHEQNQTHIYLIQNGIGGLHTERVEIEPPQIDIDLHYNADFAPVHERLIGLLSQPKGKGLVLLHGEPGTGKTTYIKYLSSLVQKDMLILPPYMTNYLTAPEFVPFLLENRDSILIIEDAERILQAREAGGDTNSVSNILNLTDGLLADCMHIQIIATFNASKSLLDKALLRKGRLMVDYAFGKLTPAKANHLLAQFDLEYRTQEPMTLADIFNFDDQTVSGARTEAKVGF